MRKLYSRCSKKRYFFPGIYQINIPLTGFALKRINAYLIRGDRGWVMVDCGWNTPEAFAALQATLQKFTIGFKDIYQIIITHLHPDHYGMAGRLKELCGCTLAMHEIGANLIESRYVNVETLLGDVEKFLVQNGVPEKEAALLRNASMPALKFVVPAFPETVYRGGETISIGKFTFKVIWTPGHSPDHICLYEAAHKVLLAGDQVLPVITPNVSLHAQQRGDPLADFLQSLRDLNGLDVDLVLPGHDDVFSNIHTRIQELVEHHDRRNDEVLGICRDKPMTAYEMAPRISWVTSEASWRNLPPLDKRLAALETLAHVEFLYNLGKVQKTSQDGRTYYQNVIS